MGTLGIDIGGTFAKSVVLDVEGHTVHRQTDLVPDGDLIEFAIDLARRRTERHDVERVGVGIAGLVDHASGAFVWGPHVRGHDVPVAPALEHALGLEVIVDNDANLAALAESRLGAGRGVDDLIMLTFGTGIGAGIVIGGELYRGAGFAGEVGHMAVQPDGERCACGRRGCWETLVSGRRLDEVARGLRAAAPDGVLARVVGSETVAARHLSESADLGDLASARALAEAGSWLGHGVAMLVSVLDPQLVVVGGAVAAAGDHLLAPARRRLAEALSGAEFRREVPLAAAELGPFAGAIGAALSAQT